MSLDRGGADLTYVLEYEGKGKAEKAETVGEMVRRLINGGATLISITWVKK